MAAPRKRTAAKKEVKAQVFVQYLGKEISVDSLVEEAKKAFVVAGHQESEIETISVYVKPEENAAYYAVNGAGSEEYKIQLQAERERKRRVRGSSASDASFCCMGFPDNWPRKEQPDPVCTDTADNSIEDFHGTVDNACDQIGSCTESSAEDQQA